MDFYTAQLFDFIRIKTGYDITPLAPLAAIVFGAVSALLPLGIFLVSMRRRMAELKSLTAKIETTAQDATDKTVGKFEKLHDDFRASVSGQIGEVAGRVDNVAGGIESLKTYLKSTTEVTAIQADTEIREELQAAPLSKPRRLTLAENVRNSVMTKWLAGGYLLKSESDPNVFRFFSNSLTGEKIALVLHTPYRTSLGKDGRLPFALDVWVNNKKHLNFEWNTEGAYALRGFTRGDWIEDVAMWSFPVGVTEQAVPHAETQAA